MTCSKFLKMIGATALVGAAIVAGSGCAVSSPKPVTQVASRTPVIIAPSELEDGADFNAKVTGLQPGAAVRVHGLRRMSKWQKGEDGNWRQIDVTMQAWGEFTASQRGEIDLQNQAPKAGTWRNPGAIALFWAGYPQGARELDNAAPQVSALQAPSAGSLLIAVTNDTGVLATSTVKVIAPKGITTKQVREAGLVGVFAAPTNARQLPVIVLLHGSEGGKLDNAASDAARFAAQGYAVLAVTYFSYPYEAIPGTPNAHVNIPIETLEKARNWLATQAEADVERFGIFGVSKGAEFAALAASRYPWIDAVVPCVGSDVAWEGYGVEPRPSPPPSSWSWQSQPVSAIDLIPYVEGDPRFKTNTQRYDLSRARNSEAQRQAAIIPIENARAQFLFIGGDRDKVWASGNMSRALFARLRANGQALGSRLRTYPLAGHNICGSGLFPIRLYGVQGNADYEPDLTAEGEATVDAWRETRAFFARALRSR